MTPYPTPGLASCMITFAGPRRRATPSKPSSMVGLRPSPFRAEATRAGALIGRSTWLSLTVIGHSFMQCANTCFQILPVFADRCQDGRVAQVRPYGGVEASERLALRRRRLLEAGLELLGGSDNHPELTVRALCAEAGVSARYFYEGFTDKD